MTLPITRPDHAGQGQVEIPLEDRETLRASVTREGLAAVAKASGLARETVVRILAGLPVRRGSALLLERFLTALREQEAGPLAGSADAART